jgi:signal transduction histidine kinase
MRAPTPGLDQVPALVDSVGRAGLEVGLDLAADPTRVSKPIGTAAYRIVQESLTNVVRHAGVAAAAVTIRGGDDGGLVVEITDDGAGNGAGAQQGAGVGIAGMRERAESTGGRLEAGPRPGGGFRVRVEWEARK